MAPLPRCFEETFYLRLGQKVLFTGVDGALEIDRCFHHYLYPDDSVSSACFFTFRSTRHGKRRTNLGYDSIASRPKNETASSQTRNEYRAALARTAPHNSFGMNNLPSQRISWHAA